MNEHSKSGTNKQLEHGINKPGAAVTMPAETNRVAGVAGSIGAGGARDALTEVLRKGAVELLASAVRAEVARYNQKLWMT